MAKPMSSTTIWSLGHQFSLVLTYSCFPSFDGYSMMRLIIFHDKGMLGATPMAND